MEDALDTPHKLSLLLLMIPGIPCSFLWLMCCTRGAAIAAFQQAKTSVLDVAVIPHGLFPPLEKS